MATHLYGALKDFNVETSFVADSFDGIPDTDLLDLSTSFETLHAHIGRLLRFTALWHGFLYKLLDCGRIASHVILCFVAELGLWQALLRRDGGLEVHINEVA